MDVGEQTPDGETLDEEVRCETEEATVISAAETMIREGDIPSEVQASLVAGHEPTCDLVNPGAWAIIRNNNPNEAVVCTCKDTLSKSTTTENKGSTVRWSLLALAGILSLLYVVRVRRSTRQLKKSKRSPVPTRIMHIGRKIGGSRYE